MENKKCLFCDQDISVNARICPYCQKTQLTSNEIESTATSIISYKIIGWGAITTLAGFNYKWWVGTIVLVFWIGRWGYLSDKYKNKYKPYQLVEMLKDTRKSFYINLVIIIAIIIGYIIYKAYQYQQS